MTRPSRSACDIHQDITDRIIAAIVANPDAKPVMPWNRSGLPMTLPVNAHTANTYNGINIPILWCAAEERGYQSGHWATYRQWTELGAQVRKGEKSSPVIFYKEFEVEPDAEDADDDGKRRMARWSNVFNADQVEGYDPDPVPDRPMLDRLASVDRYVAATGALILIGGQIACYRPSADTIMMPDEQRFFATDAHSRSENFYAVELHELIHWTGAEHRLARTFGKRFGDDAYAMEELVAELGAAFQCAQLGITHAPREDHAAYIGHWLKILKADNRAIFAAAAKASQAVAHLDALQTKEPA